MLIIQNTADNFQIPIIFKIQILTSNTSIPLTSSRFREVENVQEYSHKGLFKYTIGGTPDFEQSLALKTEMKKKGFQDAFVVAFYNDVRISMRTALKLLKQ